MLKKVMAKSKALKKRMVDYESLEYWQGTTPEEEVEAVTKFWTKVSAARKQAYTVKDIVDLKDLQILNALFAEEIMGWIWSDNPIFYIENIIPGGFMVNEKVKTNVTFYSHKCSPAQLSYFIGDEFVFKILERLKIQNIRYGMQPIEEGYEIYCEEHRLSIYGKTLGEVVCKLALITLVDTFK